LLGHKRYVAAAPALACTSIVNLHEAKCMFVALATTSKQIQVVQVALSWGYPPPENGKNIPPASIPLNPSLKGRHVAISGLLPGTPSESHLDPAMTQISLLEFIPTSYNSSTKTWHPPVVLTVRSFVPTPDIPYNQEVQSIIDRWELVLDQNQTLHDAFENLSSRRSSVGAPPSVCVI
jgi:mediator of RNA polymerase II transcription subunit 16, fungi type